MTGRSAPASAACDASGSGRLSALAMLGGRRGGARPRIGSVRAPRARCRLQQNSREVAEVCSSPPANRYHVGSRDPRCWISASTRKFTSRSRRIKVASFSGSVPRAAQRSCRQSGRIPPRLSGRCRQDNQNRIMGSQTFEVRCDHEALQFSLGSLMWPRVKWWSTRGSRGGSDAAPTGPQASKSVAPRNDPRPRCLRRPPTGLPLCQFRPQ